jgi:hypothetical protein
MADPFNIPLRKTKDNICAKHVHAHHAPGVFISHASRSMWQIVACGILPHCKNRRFGNMRRMPPRPISQFCHIKIKEQKHIILFDDTSMIIPNPAACAAGTALSALEKQKNRKSQVARERFEWLLPNLGLVWQG